MTFSPVFCYAFVAGLTFYHVPRGVVPVPPTRGFETLIFYFFNVFFFAASDADKISQVTLEGRQSGPRGSQNEAKSHQNGTKTSSKFLIPYFYNFN